MDAQLTSLYGKLYEACLNFDGQLTVSGAVLKVSHKAGPLKSGARETRIVDITVDPRVKDKDPQNPLWGRYRVVVDRRTYEVLEAQRHAPKKGYVEPIAVASLEAVEKLFAELRTRKA
jgi:hypothetical protein